MCNITTITISNTLNWTAENLKWSDFRWWRKCQDDLFKQPTTFVGQTMVFAHLTWLTIVTNLSI